MFYFNTYFFLINLVWLLCLIVFQGRIRCESDFWALKSCLALYSETVLICNVMVLVLLCFLSTFRNFVKLKRRSSFSAFLHLKLFRRWLNFWKAFYIPLFDFTVSLHLREGRSRLWLLVSPFVVLLLFYSMAAWGWTFIFRRYSDGVMLLCS